MTEASSLLEVRGLEVRLRTAEGDITALAGIDLDIGAGESVGVVGESGSGKSMTALAIMRLIPSPPGRISGGQVKFEGSDLLRRSERDMRSVRGSEIAMIFQEPMTSLNPVISVGSQIVEAILLHERVSLRAARARAVEMLGMVGVPSPAQRAKQYPHEMSGGMRQRVMIAMAIACRPKLLIADEPTTALDVTVQAQILELLADLQDELGMSVMLITHNLGVVAEFTRRVVVMYAGRIVEEGTIGDVFDGPLHPYTEGLLASVPTLTSEVDRLKPIEGMVPSPYHPVSGCPFHPRCPYVQEACRQILPPLLELTPGRRAACIRHTGYALAPEVRK